MAKDIDIIIKLKDGEELTLMGGDSESMINAFANAVINGKSHFIATANERIILDISQIVYVREVDNTLRTNRKGF